MLLCDKIVEDNSLLGKFSAWQMGLFRKLA